MFNYKAYAEVNNKVAFHIIMFIGFVAAFYIMPFIQVQVPKYIHQTYLQVPLTYLATYVVALYILPEIGAYIYLRSGQD